MTPHPEPTAEKRGRHARPDDDDDTSPPLPAAEPAAAARMPAAPMPAAPVPAAPRDEEAPRAAARRPEPTGSTKVETRKVEAPNVAAQKGEAAKGEAPKEQTSHSLGHHPAGFPLLLSAGLVTGLSLAPLLFDQLRFDIATRAARAARSVAASWPAGGEPWFWPDWVATTAGLTAAVVLVLAVLGLRVPDLAVLVLGVVLTVTTARAAWATLDVVNSFLWELLTVCTICLLAFGLAATAAARWRSPRENAQSGGGGGAAGVAVGGWVMVALLLFAGAAIASSAEANAVGAAGPPQNVPGLLSMRAADAADLRDLRGAWVPQLGAAQVTDDATATAYAARHDDVRTLYSAVLVRGDDLGVDDLDDSWWLTLARQAYGSAAEAQAWCTGNAVPACVPRLVGG